MNLACVTDQNNKVDYDQSFRDLYPLLFGESKRTSFRTFKHLSQGNT